MKYLIASDIHGEISGYYCLKERCREEQPDKVILLGDIMGSRCNAKEINAIVDQINAPIVAVMGNCDREECIKMFHVENKGLKYEEYVESKLIFCTHGHIYGAYGLPKTLKRGDIFLYGHWHKGKIEEVNGIVVGNAGSLSHPRDSQASYIMLSDKEIILKNESGEIIKQLELC